MNQHVNNVIDMRNPIQGFRKWQQTEHGKRVEERQRVNGQPNGYRATSEAELQANEHKPTHGGYPSHPLGYPDGIPNS